MSRETTGDNATLSYGSAASGPFTAIAKTIMLTPNKIAAKQVETTEIDSAADLSQAGTPDYGEVQLTVATTATLTTTVNGWVANKTSNYFKLTMDDFSSTDSQEVFYAWVKEFEPLGGELKKDQRAESKLTLKISGVPTFTAGS